MKTVCLGEVMFRLSPPGNQRFRQAEAFEVHIGGSEANVAAALAQFGEDAQYVTRLPDNELGQRVIDELRRFGVGVGGIVRGGERVGVYYLETGASQRPSKVIYDRAHSAMAEVKPSDFDWDSLLDGAACLHVSGITPALGEGAASAVSQACVSASEAGIRVSFDLNYRRSLWSAEKAYAYYAALLPYIDLLFCGYQDALSLLEEGARPGDKTPDDGELETAGAALCRRFGLTEVVFSLRDSVTASDNTFSAAMYDAQSAKLYKSRNYAIHIVDRIGGGDALDAGTIYSLLNGASPLETIEFAAAAAVYKHSVPGDFLVASADEIRTLVKTGSSGRVMR